MKKLLIMALAASAFLISCQGTSGDKANTTTEQAVSEQTGATYVLESENSSLKWTGYHKGGVGPRFGTLKGEGTLSAEGGSVTGGSFIIDINSVLTDESSVDVATTGGKTAADLDAHLKNADFFESDKYPTAKFEITGVSPFDAAKDQSVVEGATNTISGNLTIKDKTVNVTFPAKVNVTDTHINVESKFTIKRQDWGLTYGTEGNPKDWGIAQEIDIELNINAKK
ncbi:MAG: YceI family protein [Leadbetterella sp.]|nr:YceI family protein [Leadbetterella sp.]